MKRIIVSLDDEGSLYNRINKIIQNKERISSIKLGATSFALVENLREYTNLPIIYDHQKLADIGETIEKIIKQISCKLEENKDGIIMLGYVGSKSIETFINLCKQKNLKSYIVVKMSHEKGYEFLKEDAAREICEVSLNLGANGIICPVWDFDLIRKCKKMIDDTKNNSKLATVGLRDLETAKKSVDSGTDYIITGTFFFNAPRKDLEEMLSL